jgi:hypothetical protein
VIEYQCEPGMALGDAGQFRAHFRGEQYDRQPCLLGGRPDPVGRSVPQQDCVLVIDTRLRYVIGEPPRENLPLTNRTIVLI